MTSGMRTIIYPVKDLDLAKAVYGSLLNVAPTVDAAYYVGYDVGDQHVGLAPHGHAEGVTGPVGYWHVDDIEATRGELLAAGAVELQSVKDVGGGKLTASVKDADGNVIGLIQPS